MKNNSVFFTLTNKITLDAQLRTFQYKIIHRINYYAHTRLDKWCDKCYNIIETLEHLFHLCPEKWALWYQVADWISPQLEIYPFINTYNIFVGIYNENRWLENTIILLLKRLISVKKFNQENIELIGFKIKRWCFRPLLCTLFRLNWAKLDLKKSLPIMPFWNLIL